MERIYYLDFPREGACPTIQSHVVNLSVAGEQKTGARRRRRPEPSLEFPGERQDRQSKQPRTG